MDTTLDAPSADLSGWWPHVQRARARLQAENSSDVDAAEIEGYIEWLHEEDDDRIERIYREMEQQQP